MSQSIAPVNGLYSIALNSDGTFGILDPSGFVLTGHASKDAAIRHLDELNDGLPSDADAPAEFEPIGPDEDDRRWASENLNSDDDWHAVDEIDPATDGELESDIRWLERMAEVEETARLDDLISRALWW